MAVVMVRETVSRKLTDVVRREVDLYAGDAYKEQLVAIFDEVRHLYCVIAIAEERRDHPPQVVIMAQVVEDKIVIIEDITDKPLYEALMVNAKIPREQIILEYAGEKLPQAKAD